MCGIFGTIGWISSEAENEHILSHRGPDDYASYVGSCCGSDFYVDHHRLSIIGLGKQGRQPFVSDDESVILVYNGEIYNYESLKQELTETCGVTFETSTDTEVLLKAYTEWGIDRLLDELVGMFSFGLVDKTAERVYIVRDHMGVKPVYYHEGPQGLSFASEVKALLSKTDLKPRLNRDVLGEYLANFWVYEPDTMFDGVYKLEAGHYLEYSFNDGSTEKQQYWDILDEKCPTHEANLSEDLARIVQDQLVSDVPIGMYLSGGIDSSLVAYYASQAEELTALNLRNDEGNRDGEYHNLQRLEETLKLDVESFSADESMYDIYREMIYYLDEPIADPAVIPAFLLARESRERGIKVMLSGMGGDELFAGYRRMSVLSKQHLLRPLSPLVSLVDWLYPDQPSRRRRNVRRAANFLDDPSPENYFALTYYFSRGEITELLGGEDWTSRYKQKIRSMLDGKEFVDELQKYQYLDVRGYLASHNLIYMDKASMAASTEVRVPLLDHRFASKYFNMPTEEKLSEGLKTPLRIHAEELFRFSISGQKKEGFSFPIDDFITSDSFRRELNDLLTSERIADLFDVETIQRIVDRHFAEKEDNAMKIWALYTLWLWLNEFDVTIEE